MAIRGKSVKSDKLRERRFPSHLRIYGGRVETYMKITFAALLLFVAVILSASNAFGHDRWRSERQAWREAAREHRLALRDMIRERRRSWHDAQREQRAFRRELRNEWRERMREFHGSRRAII